MIEIVLLGDCMDKLTIKEFLYGCKMSLPIGAGYIPLGFGCGVVCVEAGFTPLECVFMSLIVYAGAGQYTAAGMVLGGASIPSIIITTFIINMRHILYGSVLYTYVSNWSFFKQSLFASQITDEVFALHTSMMSKEGVHVGTAFGVNMFVHFSWIIGNALGAYSAELLSNSKKYGLDFTLYALFIALVIPRLINKPSIFAAFISAFTAVIFALNDMQYIGIIAGALSGAFAGYLLNRRLNNE